MTGETELEQIRRFGNQRANALEKAHEKIARLKTMLSRMLTLSEAGLLTDSYGVKMNERLAAEIKELL